MGKRAVQANFTAQSIKVNRRSLAGEKSFSSPPVSVELGSTVKGANVRNRTIIIRSTNRTILLALTMVPDSPNTRGQIVTRKQHITVLLVAAAVLGSGFVATAAEPPPSPPTLWSFLGIPQGVNKVRDAQVNKRGNHPLKERQPELKRIADPANLESPNPAIKAAAKIKAEEDLAPQKVKAIKYLATIGCGCYPGVREALLAALDDCTEEVRYAAAVAFCQAAGNPCKFCDRAGCCNAAVIAKLDDMAHGMDEEGCFKESSARVRAAAENAANACRMVVPPEPEPAPKKELPVETAPGAVPSDQAPTPPGNGTGGANISIGDDADEKQPATQSNQKNSVIVRPASTPLGQADTQSDSSHQTSATPVGLGRRCPVGCRSQRCPHVAPSGAQPGTEPGAPAAQPGEVAPRAAAEEAAPSPYALAGDFGAVSGPLSAAPNMIGDFYGAGLASQSLLLTYYADGNYYQGTKLRIPNPTAGGVVGRVKIADNTSPIPRDRVFGDYNLFNNVPLTDDGVNVHRFTPGFEKTFLDGLMSFELKIPMAQTMDNDVVLGQEPNPSHGEFGNMAMTVKSLLLQRETWVLSGGLTVAVPTADATHLLLPDGTVILEIQNKAVHLEPFLGYLWTPNERWFSQGYIQWDVATNGNPVLASSNQTNDLSPLGKLHDTLFQYVDLGLGRWLYRSDDSTCRLTGIAATAEVHWNRSLEETRGLTAQEFQIGTNVSKIEVVDMTVGAHVEFCNRTTVSFGYGTPLGAGMDRAFDGEWRFMVNRRFGPLSRFSGITPM